jgi:hypothetical protein
MSSDLLKHLNEPAVSVDVVKGFHLYRKRNEWVNWDGYNIRVSRFESMHVSLEDAERTAEEARVQGSAFFIDELPVIAVKSRTVCLVLAQVFSEHPFKNLRIERRSTYFSTLGEVAGAIPRIKGKVKALHLCTAALAPASEPYYARSSSPGRGRNHLAWSLRKRTLDVTSIREVSADIEQAVLHD